MNQRRYASLKEVAARAGVSFQTASKFLNGGPVASPPRPLNRSLPPRESCITSPTASPAAWSSVPPPRSE